MDALIRAKVCRVLREPYLNPKVRAGLIFSTITITTKTERKKFNTILDSFLEKIKTNNMNERRQKHEKKDRCGDQRWRSACHG